jgi:hypothetical protein
MRKNQNVWRHKISMGKLAAVNRYFSAGNHVALLKCSTLALRSNVDGSTLPEQPFTGMNTERRAYVQAPTIVYLPSEAICFVWVNKGHDSMHAVTSPSDSNVHFEHGQRKGITQINT